MDWTNTFKVSLLSGLLLGAVTVQAQVYMPTMEEFGKNRIQRERYDWQVLTTSNFEIYFHGNSRSLATYTAQMAESEFDRITDLLSYTPYSRTKIFLYDSPADLKQSNIGVSLNSIAEIREENLSKSRVQIAFTANHMEFRKQLAKEVSSVFVYDMLYGGSLKDALQSQLLLSLPEWFISGITAYVAEGWSRDLDDYMRDVALNKKFKKPTQLTGDEATRIGQSIWNFIAERYGRDNISNILNLTRIIRTEQTSISSTLGISYARFVNDWKDYYTQMATSTAGSFQPAGGTKLAGYHLFSGQQIEQVKLSPDRRMVVYSMIDHGRYRVYVTGTQGGKPEELLVGGDRFLTRELPIHAPLLAFQDNGTLNILTQQDDRILLSQYVPGSKKGLRLKARRFVRGFNQIAGFDISQDGSTLAISGDRKGQSDLFLYNISRNGVTQLTNDLYDDLTPSFVGRSNSKVLFTSNRTTDTLSTKPVPTPLPTSFNLFLHEGNARANTVQRLASRATQPFSTNGEKVFFLSDEQGIQNLYVLDTTAQQVRPLSQFAESINAFDYNPNSGALAYVSLEKGQQVLKFLPGLSSSAINPDASTMRNIRLNGGINKAQGAAVADPTKAPVGVGNASRIKLRPGEVDTDNYQFDLEGLKVTERRTNQPAGNAPRVITNSRSRTTVVRRDATRLKGPTNYKDVFVVNKTDNQFLVLPYLTTPGSGFGWQNTITINDMLENNIIKGGLFITPTFRTSEIFAEYQYLAHRIDFSARFDRRAFADNTFTVGTGMFTKYRYNRLTLTASYPINEALRVSASPMFTLLNRVDGSQGSSGIPNASSSFVGLQGEVVFDNTRTNGRNLLEGSRVKLRAQQQQGMRLSSESFYKITLDARNYTKIYRDLTLATRISFGNSGGAAPKQSILGGVDNWIPFGNVREVRNAENPLSPYTTDYRNVFFTDFVTPLRGFRMNKLSGESYLLFNAELRWPVFRVLSRGPLTSTFLQNFQLTAFTDVGTAWTGNGPFSRQNSLNTEIVSAPGSVWTATVNNFKNPYLIGYGVGVRTLFLGYYVKGDFAWGVEDKTTQTPILHISLGHDF
ncbi:hypothetical protein BWI96_08805 [Siphonobacter sp. SORGH_AS_0500]|uniref:PD40 domain-containing protein n=1 Tax=Siphonobacter sp. SORGH_AS_0500 TaxID=1864824 RepID=UPI000CA9FB1A|nr:PD40 domain-containing protein [Siphonobacter sp. SORGH_AS_0500]PKK36970.1 hypothetical protein BWI96_08805 [Siphonobacter sp. SORGH_AS_0500]